MRARLYFGKLDVRDVRGGDLLEHLVKGIGRIAALDVGQLCRAGGGEHVRVEHEEPLQLLRGEAEPLRKRFRRRRLAVKEPVGGRGLGLLLGRGDVEVLGDGRVAVGSGVRLEPAERLELEEVVQDFVLGVKAGDELIGVRGAPEESNMTLKSCKVSSSFLA